MPKLQPMARAGKDTWIPTELSLTNAQSAIALLAGTPDRLVRLSRGLTDDKLQRPLGQGERSFCQALAHLLNSEARQAEAIHMGLLLREPQLQPVHTERDFGTLVRYDLLPVGDLLRYFETRRRMLLHVLAQLTMQQWSRCSREPGKQRKESVFWRARSMALHELEHTTDLEDKLRRLGFLRTH